MKKEELGLLFGTAAMYLMAIMPRRKNRADRMEGVFYAHRGLHEESVGIPENTMAAFARAVDAGYGIELDIQLTKDEQVVVFHDMDLKRLCCADGQVCDYTYEELQRFHVADSDERIPLLRDVLELVDGKVPLLVELKYRGFSNRICEKADALLSRYKGRYSIESFHPWALIWYKKHRPEICRGQLAMNFQRQEGNYGVECYAVRHLLLNFLAKPDFIAYDIRDRKAVSKNICRKLFGCPSAAWTVRSREQLEQIRPYYDSFIFEGFHPKEAHASGKERQKLRDRLNDPVRGGKILSA